MPGAKYFAYRTMVAWKIYLRYTFEFHRGSDESLRDVADADLGSVVSKEPEWKRDNNINIPPKPNMPAYMYSRGYMRRYYEEIYLSGNQQHYEITSRHASPEKPIQCRHIFIF